MHVDKLFKKALKKEKKMKKLKDQQELLKAERDILIEQIRLSGQLETEKYQLSFVDITPWEIIKDKFIDLFGTKEFIKVASIKMKDAEKEYTKDQLIDCMSKGKVRGYYVIKSKGGK